MKNEDNNNFWIFIIRVFLIFTITILVLIGAKSEVGSFKYENREASYNNQLVIIKEYKTRYSFTDSTESVIIKFPDSSTKLVYCKDISLK